MPTFAQIEGALLQRIFIIATLVAVGALGACGSKKGPPGNWLARVDVIQGTVTIVGSGGGGSHVAAKGAYLAVGATLVTGADGRTTLSLRNGGRLDVKPNTTLRLLSKRPASEVDLKLLAGSVESMAPSVEAAGLVINIGGRRIRLEKAAKATVSLPEGSVKNASVLVSFGKASVENAGGGETEVIAGQTLNLKLDAPKKKVELDAGVAEPDQAVVTAAPLTFYLKNAGRGRVYVRQPGERRFHLVRRRKTVKIRPDTELKLLRGAKVVVGAEKGKGGMTLRGPAHLVVRQAATPGPDGKPIVRVESTAGDLIVHAKGRPGKRGSKLSVEGVKIATHVTWRRLDVKVHRSKGRASVIVTNGAALLTDAHGKVTRLEAGQRAAITKGKVGHRVQTPAGRLQIRRPGFLRVFTSSRRAPLTLRWPAGQGDVLVEMSRSSKFKHPFFADVLKRHVLTLPNMPRGTFYWRVRPVKGGAPSAPGTKGRIVLLVDTSHRVLRSRPPKNTIDERDGDTRVYYQNALPRFTFRWRAVSGASRYQLKIFREGNLARPIVRKDTRKVFLKIRRSLSEGHYLWYVTARSRKGKVVRGTKSRRLTLRYDNRTPNVQIVYPRNGLVLRKASIDVRGVTTRGSKIYVNGVAAELDESYRFHHTVSLKRGENRIRFRVEDKRNGSSVYLRYVTRR